MALHLQDHSSLTLGQTPRAASPHRTPPGPEGSKGTWALAGVRGVPHLSLDGDIAKTPRQLHPTGAG